MGYKLGGVLLAAALGAGALELRGAQAVGRYQIVNPAPQMRGQFMLLDTSTGNTWLACGTVQGEPLDGWCKMRVGEFAPPKKQP